MYDSERALKGKISIKYMWTPHKGDAVSFEPGYPVVNDEFTKSGKYNLTKVSHLSPRFIIFARIFYSLLIKMPGFSSSYFNFCCAASLQIKLFNWNEQYVNRYCSTLSQTIRSHNAIEFQFAKVEHSLHRHF